MTVPVPTASLPWSRQGKFIPPASKRLFGDDSEPPPALTNRFRFTAIFALNKAVYPPQIGA